MKNSYLVMDPFNIKITVANNNVALTILPALEGYYKVVYYGGVLGAIVLGETDVWENVPENEVITADLPPYHEKEGENRIPVTLDEQTILQIGKEIERYSQSVSDTSA